ncbi:MAG: hypothetical protein HQL24_03925 [Candidatus Omnitrophica bacterium]|nr:hypothetical protein [Candidatus Omnitrophota bacterium]
MLNKLLRKWGMIGSLLLLIFLSQVTSANARPGARDHDERYFYHHRYPFGHAERVLPRGGISITFGGGRFFYSAGIFYRQHSSGYIVVPAPVGAVVYDVPAGYHRVIIDGVTYFTYDGIYYQKVFGGYRVVEVPEPVVVEPTTVVSNSPVEKSPDTFTVNIPNSTGGYTAVTLKVSGKGFIGPQGEFYPEFPKVEQLRTMYVK